MKGRSFGNDIMIIKNSRWLSHDSYGTVLTSDWLTHFLSSKLPALQGWKSHPERGRERELDRQGPGQRPKAILRGPLDQWTPPGPALETPPELDEMRRRVAEEEWLEEVGRSPQSLPTQQLAQMATEAGPSTSDGEEPARKKLHPTEGDKTPRKEFLTAGKLRKPWRYWPVIMALHKIFWFQKST